MSTFFQRIIAPYSLEEFFEKFHEKDMLHISRNDKNYYNNILTSREISAFLDRQDIFYPSLRVVKEGKEIPSSQYTKNAVPIGHHKKDGIIHTEKAFALFNQGSTLVIQAGQRYFDNLSKCCMNLSQKFNSPVQANLYITPNKSQGFNPHWDTHDVFVLQISGTKTWNLYGFEKELPTKNQSFISKGYDKKPLQTLQLTPGDFLYVPRGYVHDAMADDGISAHITIGILSFTWARFFSEVFPQLENFKEFREAVPFWKDDLDEIIKQKTAALKNVLDELDFSMGIERLNAQYQKTQPQPVNNYFQSLLDINEFSEQTVFALNESVIYTTSKDNDHLRIRFFEKTISLPLSAETLMNSIFKQKQFTLAQLPQTITTENKKNILKLLLREGLVHIRTL
ncbi:cupin domain-containing protein [Haoranjiania flava]|uniref:Cupin n=1 Tax=Haoranjiania flava TaxID=1856322 RepID=A0AAE3LKF7_9BACT|nr:cupin domain-containing protein [Haoranjiania flava]MCU7694349.1 cupin [Haoranjiania flava]